MDKEINKKYLSKMKDLVNCNYGIETAHLEADEILMELLRELGYIEIVKIFEEMPKWYS